MPNQTVPPFPAREAILLLGGQGTRLRGQFPARPKALVPVAGQSILERQLDWLARHDFGHIHLAAGYRADRLAAWLKEHKPGHLDITMSVEPEPLGTGGALRFAASYVQADPFFVLNGDSLAPRLDFQALQDTHLDPSCLDGSSGRPRNKRPAPRPALTLAVTHIKRTGRFGTVEFDDSGRVTAFLEKTDREAGWINAGVYLVQRSALDHLPSAGFCSIEEDLLPRLAAQSMAIACPCPPPLLDMGTPEGLEEMEQYLARR